MVTGGTGSFGNAVVRRFLGSDIGEIRVFSRDEKKQDDMRRHYADPTLKFYLGNVRNPASLRDAMSGVDYVFHAAALKQVPSCEFFPLEALLTNSLGTENVLSAAIAAGADGLLVEVHPDPETALSDGYQSLDFEQFGQAMTLCRKMADCMGRQITLNEEVEVAE